MTAPQTPPPGVPLSAESVKLLVKGDLLRCDRWNGEMFTAGREYAVVSIDADGDPVLISDEGESVPVCLIHQFTFVRRPAPTAPADVSTKPLETNTSAGRVKEAAKNEHVTAPVKAGGSERWTEDMEREKREADYERGFRHGKEEALRPQPSGETLQSLAQAFEDAMEGSHGAWAVSGDYSPLSATTVADKIQADTDAKLTDCPSGETREAVARELAEERMSADKAAHNECGTTPYDQTIDDFMPDALAFVDRILSLLSPAAPDAGGGALASIAAERRRQVEDEGWTPEHDDEHDDYSLGLAAASYAGGVDCGSKVVSYTDDVSGGRGDAPVWGTRKKRVPTPWPASWDPRWWKPTGDRRRDLVKAGALIVAEIERLDRAALQPGGER